MIYWYERATGRMLRAIEGDSIGYGRFAHTSDVAGLPAPLQFCRWNGTSVEIDTARVAARRGEVYDAIDRTAMTRAAWQVTTPQGTFRVRKDEVDRYVAIGFSALLARLNVQLTWSITVHDVDGVAVALDANATLRLVAAIGDRYYALMQQAQGRKAEVGTATPEQLANFDPGSGIG